MLFSLPILIVLVLISILVLLIGIENLNSRLAVAIERPR